MMDFGQTLDKHFSHNDRILLFMPLLIRSPDSATKQRRKSFFHDGAKN